MAKRTDQEKKQANTFPTVSNDVDVRRRVIEKPIGSAGAIGAVHRVGPVVRSVVLPAHADAAGCTTDEPAAAESTGGARPIVPTNPTIVII
jgi:hypothetical protein